MTDLEKIDYLKSSFDNVQELIRFTDQKIAAVLVVIGIEISVFLEYSKELAVCLSPLNIQNISLFVLGIAFLTVIIVTIYQSLFMVLRPRYAKSYGTNNYSLYYFEHIALNTKEHMQKEIKGLDTEIALQEVQDQLFEVSTILYKKNKYCSKNIQSLFVSIVINIVYVLIIRLTT